MPQINRIRVNNVKYNFGTQFYDDFMMRFNCSNTLYDLANGGGKSLLMLLLMQNVIPNCTLDDKQPIEKLFRQGSGNTVIHSLVEWKLDPCYQKDNYKFMTTGFCARRAGGRGADEEAAGAGRAGGAGSVGAAGAGTLGTKTEGYGGTGGAGRTGVGNVSIGSSSVGNVSAGSSGAAVEYFNYCIFYRGFGDNDIKNLPLESNGERITYNGLKAYLRDLEKIDSGVSVRIFETKGEYMSFLSQYGIFESQWEIVRGINKTEGHVRTYFENNYKTGRKVVEDLLIEEIIQRSYNNTIGVDNDEDTMAHTLMDIKDKLLELSKKHAQINGYDRQIEALGGFAGYVRSFKQIYDEKDRLLNSLYQLMLSCKQELANGELKISDMQGKLDTLEKDRHNELRLAAIGEIAEQESSLEDMNKLIDDASREIARVDEQTANDRTRLTELESAQDYRDYREYSLLVKQIDEFIENRNLGNEEITGKMRLIASQMKNITDKKRKDLAEEYDAGNAQLDELKEKRRCTSESVTESLQDEAAVKAQAEYVKLRVEELTRELTEAMENAGLIITENADELLAETEGKLALARDNSDNLKLNISDMQKKEDSCRNRCEVLAMNANMYKEQLALVSEKRASREEDGDRVGRLLAIYGVSTRDELISTLASAYEKMGKRLMELEREACDLETFVKNASAGTYVCRSPLRDRLAKYLNETYGDDVVEGHEWFRNLNPGQKRDVFKRVPFAEYAFVIKNDFDRIKDDAALMNFGRGACVYPIISENVLYDTKLEVNTELVAFAMKDMNFLRDDAVLEAEIRSANEELDGVQAEIDKLTDRKGVVWDDYSYVCQLKLWEASSSVIDADEIEQRLRDCESEIKSTESEAGNVSQALEAAKKRMAELAGDIDRLTCRAEALSRVIGINSEIKLTRSELDELEKKRVQSTAALAKMQDQREELDRSYDEAQGRCESLRREIDRLDDKWNELYAPYCEGITECDVTADRMLELEGEFLGLKELLDRENSDLSDKETLRRTYRNSMDKCVRSIEYRGNDFEDIKRRVDGGEIEEIGHAAMYELKNSITKRLEAAASKRREFESLNAMKNRVEGSIEHGIRSIRENYGEYEKIECDNPQEYIKQHKNQANSIKAELSDARKELSEFEKSLKDVYVCDKNLERIITGAGLSVPDEDEVRRLAGASLVGDGNLADDRKNERADVSASLVDGTMNERTGATANLVDGTMNERTEAFVSLADGAINERTEAFVSLLDGAINERAETAAREYDRHMKVISRKKDEFAKKKEELATLLEGCGSVPLADEVRASLDMPQDSEQTEQSAQRLMETAELIRLEKDRVFKGIEDMERIKDNFENRCIQTCCNIKTDLDRLPRMSTVKIDDETVPIVGLYIPYVPEDSYKERMSSYIDETVEMAESFPQGERLKYIRNRLTWKRLFSVIVTDMNAVRVNLYKRERIADQSRFLRYEEAVGSTGQSQGIYIQFLIAVINYISGINAPTGDSGVIGKTIFIDNPFGAAKDIYIWEPIFALLKANHVQLIVPARGATPAITGRFDVNYCLGQKLNDGRQTTVVVDYYSQTDTTQMEYTRMNYEQGALFFEN